MVTLDLRVNSKLEKEHALHMNCIANELHNDFFKYIESISKLYESNLDWWAEGAPDGRALYMSRLAIPFSLEIIEFIDMLRVIENGLRLQLLYIEQETIGACGADGHGVRPRGKAGAGRPRDNRQTPHWRQRTTTVAAQDRLTRQVSHPALEAGSVSDLRLQAGIRPRHAENVVPEG